MSTETQIPQPHPNSFDGRFKEAWSNDNQAVEAVMQPGNVITSTKSFLDGYRDAPTMAKIDLGEHGELWITKMDIESPESPSIPVPHVDYGADFYRMNKHSLMAVWRRPDQPELWSNLFAGAGSHLRGAANIGGGGDEVKFVRWGVQPNEINAKSVPLPDDLPQKLVRVGRDSEGVVTITALEGAKDVKVTVPMTTEHQQVLGERWAEEIENNKNPRFAKLAGVAGRVTRRLQDKSYGK